MTSTPPLPRLSLKDEAKLVRKAARGNEDAWVALYARHKGFLLHRIRRYAGRFADTNFASELESEGRRAFAEAIQRFDPKRGVRLVTLVGLLIRRYVLDFLARETKLYHDMAPPVPLDAFEEPVDEDSTRIHKDTSYHPSTLPNLGDIESADMRRVLAQGLKRLSPQLRYVVQLRYIDQWRIEDLQEHAYARPVTRARVHRDLTRALAKLREMLQ